MINLLISIMLLLLISVLLVIAYRINVRNIVKKECMVIIESKENKKVKGKIYFTELDNFNVQVKGKIEGLSKGKHGLHIHESGDLTKGCNSLRGHFNPTSKLHGGRLKPGSNEINMNRHVGDLGNIEADKDGFSEFDFIDPLIKLRGPHSIIGRSIIVHEGEDDLGLEDNKDSKITGNSGNRIGCGIIAIA